MKKLLIYIPIVILATTCDSPTEPEDCAGVAGGDATEDCSGVCGGNAYTNDFGECFITDRDGNVYNTIQIGSQLWMKENLKTTKYKEGSQIPTGYDNLGWSDLSIGAYSVYDNDVSNVETYGNLYNWYAVDDSRGICPDGWHIPTDDEWTILSDYLGGNSVAGGKLKEAGYVHWNSPNEGATNESAFTALPAGMRWPQEYYVWWGMGTKSLFWSSTAVEINSNYALGRILESDTQMISQLTDSNRKTSGLSVRCLKD